MNSRLIFVAVILSIALIGSTQNHMQDRSNWSEIVNMVLENPRFMELSKDDQIKMLNEVYTFLSGHFKQKQLSNLNGVLDRNRPENMEKYIYLSKINHQFRRF